MAKGYFLELMPSYIWTFLSQHFIVVWRFIIWTNIQVSPNNLDLKNRSFQIQLFKSHCTAIKKFVEIEHF